MASGDLFSSTLSSVAATQSNSERPSPIAPTDVLLLVALSLRGSLVKHGGLGGLSHQTRGLEERNHHFGRDVGLGPTGREGGLHQVGVPETLGYGYKVVC